MTISVTTPPAADPVTLGEVKAWAKIDTTDDDPVLATLISTATAAAENFTRRAFITQGVTLTLDVPGVFDLPAGIYDMAMSALYGGLPRVVRLFREPVQSIATVTTFSAANTPAVLDGSKYRLDGSRLVLNEGAFWPSNVRPLGACEIEYVAGYGDTSSSVPAPIKTAILMHVQRMYDERFVCGLPANCEQLLRQYRVIV